MKRPARARSSRGSPRARSDVPAAAADVNALMKFYETGRTDEDFDQGIELALARILASPKFIYRIEAEPAAVEDRPGVSPQRPRPRVAAVLLPLEHHPRR